MALFDSWYNPPKFDTMCEYVDWTHEAPLVEFVDSTETRRGTMNLAYGRPSGKCIANEEWQMIPPNDICLVIRDNPVNVVSRFQWVYHGLKVCVLGGKCDILVVGATLVFEHLDTIASTMSADPVHETNEDHCDYMSYQ